MTNREDRDRSVTSLGQDLVFFDSPVERLSQLGGFDLTENCSNNWVDNYYREVQLRPGLSLDICDEVYHCDQSLVWEHQDAVKLVSKFYLLGHHHVTSPTGIVGVAPEYIEQGGYHYLFYLPSIDETERSFAGTQMRRVRIEIDLDFLRNFIREMDAIPQLLRLVLASDTAPQFHSPVGQVTAQMHQLIQQIWQTPYQGMVGRIYLESKALELMALQLNQLLENDQGKPIVPSLNPIDLDRIHQAKDILLHNHSDPPSLMELSQQVGLYHMKLKRGFQDVFGTTPFGYLREYRLELARLLLSDRSLLMLV